MTDEYICTLVSHGNGVYEYEPTGQEIVRCGDCKWYVPAKNIIGFDMPTGVCNFHSIYINNDDYCSRGERGEWRENEAI